MGTGSVAGFGDERACGRSKVWLCLVDPKDPDRASALSVATGLERSSAEAALGRSLAATDLSDPRERSRWEASFGALPGISGMFALGSSSDGSGAPRWALRVACGGLLCDPAPSAGEVGPSAGTLPEGEGSVVREGLR